MSPFHIPLGAIVSPWCATRHTISFSGTKGIVQELRRYLPKAAIFLALLSVRIPRRGHVVCLLRVLLHGGIQVLLPSIIELNGAKYASEKGLSAV